MEKLRESTFCEQGFHGANINETQKGIFSAFVIFNFMLVFLFSWLYLHGVRNIKRWLSKRKTEKGAGSSG